MFKKWMRRVIDVATGFVAGVIMTLGWYRAKKRPTLITRRTLDRVYKGS